MQINCHSHSDCFDCYHFRCQRHTGDSGYLHTSSQLVPGIMGSGGTKIEKPNVVTQEEESEGLHIFELHLPTAGAGILMIMMVLLLLWCALPVLKRWRNTKTSKPRRGASPTPPHHSTRWDPPMHFPHSWPSATHAPHPTMLQPQHMALRFQNIPMSRIQELPDDYPEVTRPSVPKSKKPTEGQDRVGSNKAPNQESSGWT